MAISSYRELRVWQCGMDLAEACYKLTRTFPKEELFAMTSQIRRDSTAIPANIAEGYGRSGRKEYLHFLRIAQGSLNELETHLALCLRVELAGKSQVEPIMVLCNDVSKMLVGMIKSLAVE